MCLNMKFIIIFTYLLLYFNYNNNLIYDFKYDNT